MNLNLSPHDQDRLRAAFQALLSPLNHAHVDGWRSDVNRSMKDLLGADMACFMLPVDHAAPVYSEEVTRASEYPTQLEPLNRRFYDWKRYVQLGVCNREMLWHPHLEEYYRTPYYNEYIVPSRAFDYMGMAVPTAKEVSAHTIAKLLFHHEHQNGRTFGDRGLVLLRLLFPAFKAGIETYLRHAEHRAIITHTLDTLSEGLLLCDVMGRLVHQNPALLDMLAEDPERERLQQDMMSASQALVGVASNRARSSEILDMPVLRAIQTRKDLYRIRASYVGGQHFGEETYVLVVLERLAPEWPSENCLKERFGLTRQEARIALLLAQRKSNEEIAQAGNISTHTARHHTESVLSKLGVHSRKEVGPLIMIPAGER